MFSSTDKTNNRTGLDSNLALRAENLSKLYKIFDHPRDRLIEAIWGRDRYGRSKKRYDEFWALQNISFDLKKGETIGIVGRNGSGKSTLLQLLCGTLEPTTGKVITSGRIGALLELGSGFNPEFSGLDNVYLNASLLGLSQAETEDKLDAILSFADIGRFINQPVKTYSSGMAVRLAFAVQAHIDPDLLVVDEALAVGDELFQKKCYGHLEKLKETGTAVLLVTHSCPQIIQHCDKAILLSRGKMKMLDSPAKVTMTYQELINKPDNEWDRYFQALSKNTKQTDRQTKQATMTDSRLKHDDTKKLRCWMDSDLIAKDPQIYPTDGGEITSAWISLDSKSEGKTHEINHLSFGEDFKIHFSYVAHEDLNNIAMACNISTVNGQRISGQCFPKEAGIRPDGTIKKISSGEKWVTSFTFLGSLWPGLYFVSGGLLRYNSLYREFIHRVVDYRLLRIIESEGVHQIGICSLAKGSAKSSLNNNRMESS